MKMKVMSEQELEETSKKYKEIIDSEDFEEALKLNQLLYESEFIKYKILVGVREKFKKQSYMGEALTAELTAERVRKGLEYLMQSGIKLKDIIENELK